MAPKVASHIMALRGVQSGPVFFSKDGPDYVGDYLNMADAPIGVPGIEDGTKYEHLMDERRMYLVAAAWSGCIAGMLEWRALRLKEGATPMVEEWEKPCLFTWPDQEK